MTPAAGLVGAGLTGVVVLVVLRVVDLRVVFLVVEGTVMKTPPGLRNMLARSNKERRRLTL